MLKYLGLSHECLGTMGDLYYLLRHSTHLNCQQNFDMNHSKAIAFRDEWISSKYVHVTFIHNDALMQSDCTQSGRCVGCLYRLKQLCSPENKLIFYLSITCQESAESVIVKAMQIERCTSARRQSFFFKIKSTMFHHY